MAERRDDEHLAELPEAMPSRRRRWALQWVWLLPVIAALIGGTLAVRAILSDGPNITIRFKTAEGIEAGRTRIKYKDVVVGVVRSVTLADDRAGVLVRAELSKPAEDMLVEDTRFWIVRARIAGGTVSGIGTLLSGSYIGMDPGTSTEGRRDFVGLETPPVITSGLQGKQFVLRAQDIGSLDVGSPVYYRRLEAGRVVAYELEPGGTGVLVRVFVNSPFDEYVTEDTRFWHASGIDLSLDAGGLQLNTESLSSILIGGIAFQAPQDSQLREIATEKSTFQLFDDRNQAMRRPIKVTERYAVVIRESVRGLAIGAPVDFRGITVGEVTAIEPQFNRERREFSIVVEFEFYPERFFRGRAREGRSVPEGQPSLARLVERQLRAQLRTANLLTGQLYIGLDFFPRARKVALTTENGLPQIPTAPGSTQELQTQVSSIVAKLDSIPVGEISADVRKTLQTATRILERVDREITPAVRETMIEAQGTMVEARGAMTEARKALVEARTAIQSAQRTLADAETLPLEAGDTLREIGRAAQSLRVLADYLERHPEAVIRGKPR